jgi:hypothetical protein
MLEKFSTRLILSVLLISLAIWFGGSLVRSTTAYEIFEPGTKMELKKSYSNDLQLHTIRLFAYGAVYTGISYLLAFISAIVLTIRWRKYLKQNGWLFMALVIFFISAPIEIYLTYLDYELNMTILYGGVKDFWDGNLQRYFLVRFTKLSQLSPITMLSVATSLILVIWKPLKLVKNTEIKNEN